MSWRRLSLGLAVCAAALYGGVTLPARARLAAARAELQALQGRRALRDAGRTEQRRAAALLRVGRAQGSGNVVGVRGEIVRAVDGSGLAEATVDVRPARAPALAVVTVRARGSFADVLTLAQRLAEPGTGLVLERVALVRLPSAVSLDLQGSVVGALE